MDTISLDDFLIDRGLDMSSAKKKKYKLKDKRAFLEGSQHSDSYYSVSVSPRNGFTRLKLSDCHRTIDWEFGVPGDDRAKKKIAVVKKLVDEMYNHLHEIDHGTV